LVPPAAYALLVPAAVSIACLAGLVGVLLSVHAGAQDWLRASPAFAAVLVLLPLAAWRIARRSVRLDARGLDVFRLPWSRVIPVAELELDRAEVVDLAQRPPLRPTLKLVGSRVPGYCSGYFRLRGGARAAVAITDARRVLVLPRRNGNYVLLSLENPASLLEALRRAAARRG
jgi:hypothetical protein